MLLATEIVRFFSLDPARPGPVKTIDDLVNSRPGWNEELNMRELFHICSTLEKEKYLIDVNTAHRHPVLGRGFTCLIFEEQRSAYGEYEFAAHGFPRVREHFQRSVMPVIVEKEDGNPDIGTCFLVGNCHTLVTARRVVENKARVEIEGINRRPINLDSLKVPTAKNLDVAIMVVRQNAMNGLPYSSSRYRMFWTKCYAWDILRFRDLQAFKSMI